MDSYFNKFLFLILSYSSGVFTLLLKNVNAFLISCYPNIWQMTPEIHDLIDQSH